MNPRIGQTRWWLINDDHNINYRFVQECWKSIRTQFDILVFYLTISYCCILQSLFRFPVIIIGKVSPMNVAYSWWHRVVWCLCHLSIHASILLPIKQRPPLPRWRYLREPRKENQRSWNLVLVVIFPCLGRTHALQITALTVWYQYSAIVIDIQWRCIRHTIEWFTLMPKFHVADAESVESLNKAASLIRYTTIVATKSWSIQPQKTASTIQGSVGAGLGVQNTALRLTLNSVHFTIM